MAIRFDLVVSGAADVVADAADWTNRLAYRSRIKPATVASRTSDLRSYHGLRVPSARAPIQALVTPRSAKCRAGATPSTACRDSGAGGLVVCAGTGCAVADPIRLTIWKCCKNDSVVETNRSPVSAASIVQRFHPKVSRMN